MKVVTRLMISNSALLGRYGGKNLYEGLDDEHMRHKPPPLLPHPCTRLQTGISQLHVRARNPFNEFLPSLATLLL